MDAIGNTAEVDDERDDVPDVLGWQRDRFSFHHFPFLRCTGDEVARTVVVALWTTVG